MDFSPGSLFVSTVFGIVGVYYFRHGKSEANVVMMMAGGGLLAYSLFVRGMWANVLVGGVLAAAPWALRAVGIDF